ncbi:MAG TPA: DUF2231 domain-containing protein [Chthonomonas sp.]|uniref:DUF2231 domain-containing protein n=1 Tax=Chthonomonas sp. TaxID=2282153 RepID=UPI002B4B3C3C|nr:DUF2231 domain-containing protein [Chthonomonas sp.]HLI49578.1 DUF2231 domain-containing protein [Chthonomonas sp.]
MSNTAQIQRAAWSFARVLIELLLLSVVPLANAWARPQFPPIVIETYHLAPGSTDYNAAKNCTLCHVPSGPPERNPYGKDVKRALERAGATMLTPAILHSIDNLDSDGDGYTNAQEFAADTLPGDPNSHPDGAKKAGTSADSSSRRSRGNISHVQADAVPGGAAAGATSSGSLLQKILLPPHAHHPELVHFPIALFIFSLVLDLLGLKKQNEALYRAAFYNLLGAAIMAPITMITGLLAWQFVLNGEPLKGTVLYHLVFASVTTVLLWSLVGLRVKQRSTASSPSAFYWVMGVVVLVCMLITGYLGGILSGVNG